MLAEAFVAPHPRVVPQGSIEDPALPEVPDPCERVVVVSPLAFPNIHGSRV